MNRRSLLKGLVATPVVATLAPLAPRAQVVTSYAPKQCVAFVPVTRELAEEWWAESSSFEREFRLLREAMVRDMRADLLRQLGLP